MHRIPTLCSRRSDLIAISIASMILSTNSLVVEKKEKSKPAGGHSHDDEDY